MKYMNMTIEQMHHALLNKEVKVSDLVKMDIFSIGVVIAQLFLENTMFTRVNLLNYKNKGQDGDEEFKSKINKINDNYNEGRDTDNSYTSIINSIFNVSDNTNYSVDFQSNLDVDRFKILLNKFFEKQRNK